MLRSAFAGKALTHAEMLVKMLVGFSRLVAWPDLASVFTSIISRALIGA
jgi:hypothetical protein